MKTPRYRHVRFHTLKIGEMFFLGVRAFWKVDYFRGRSILGSPVVVMPWTRIRSARPFGKAIDNNVAPGYKVYDRPPVERMFASDHVALGYKAQMVIGSVNNCLVGIDRPPVEVTPGGDRTPEARGGEEKCPSS